MNYNIALGPLIKEKFDARRRHDRNFTVAYFADQINVHRSTVYQLFKQHSVDIYLLGRISVVLGHDFIAEIEGKETSVPESTVFIAVKVNHDQFQNMNLPKDIIRLMESK